MYILCITPFNAKKQDINKSIYLSINFQLKKEFWKKIFQKSLKKIILLMWLNRSILTIKLSYKTLFDISSNFGDKSKNYTYEGRFPLESFLGRTTSDIYNQ